MTLISPNYSLLILKYPDIKIWCSDNIIIRSNKTLLSGFSNYLSTLINNSDTLYLPLIDSITFTKFHQIIISGHLNIQYSHHQIIDTYNLFKLFEFNNLDHQIYYMLSELPNNILINLDNDILMIYYLTQ